jgi:hypothetical protein
MRRIVQTVEQIEESKSLISRGSLPALRMALLLLDNAAEVLMHRAVEHVVREGATVGNEPFSDPDMERWRLFRITARTRKGKLRKYFYEKARFLSEDDPSFSKALADALTAIHRYRNDAYHRDHIRQETIRPVVLVLFEIVCDLLVALKPSVISFYGRDNFSSFQERHRLMRGMYFSIDHDLPKLRNDLSSGLPLDVRELSGGLIEHLNNRRDEMIELLEYIKSEIPGVDTIDHALELSKLGSENPDSENLGIPRATFNASSRWHDHEGL